MCWAMFKNFCGGGESSQKKPGPTPIRTNPPPPLGEKSSKEEPPNDKKVAIALPPHGRRQRGARVGGRPPSHWKIKKKRLLAIWGAFLLLFLHVEAFSATFMGGGGAFQHACGGLF